MCVLEGIRWGIGGGDDVLEGAGDRSLEFCDEMEKLLVEGVFEVGLARSVVEEEAVGGGRRL